MSKIIAFRASDGLVAEIEGKSVASGATKTDVILGMLEGLESFDVTTGRKKLPEISGVYIVYVGKRLLYIGQTANLKNRFKNHHRLPEFVEANARVAWFGDDGGDRLALEGEMIDLLEPEMNGTHVTYPIGTSRNLTIRVNDELDALTRSNAAAMGVSTGEFVRIAIRNLNALVLSGEININKCSTPVNIEPENDAIDTLRQELAELRATIALQPTGDRNTALQTELTELRTLIVANTARMDRDDYTFIKDVMETLRDDKGYRKLPEQFDTQEERIDRLYAHRDDTFFQVEELTKANNNNMNEWTKQAKDREEFSKAYREVVKSVEHNCDRLVVLEKMNGVVHKSNGVIKVGTGFGKH